MPKKRCTNDAGGIGYGSDIALHKGVLVDVIMGMDMNTVLDILEI